MDKGNEFQKTIASWGRRRVITTALILLGAAVVSALGIFLLKSRSEKENKVSYKTEEVTRGDLTVRISATGTLQPLNQVEIGVEISGTIERVEVDYNSVVKKGQLLAKLDTSKLEAQVQQSKAELELARAKEKEAEAELLLSRTKLGQLRQAREISGGRVPSQAEMDIALANVSKAEAMLLQARSSVSKAEADLKLNQTNLSKAYIRSPLDGIVLARKIEPGQTVAASLQTPVLFTIAEDLSKMELKVDVDEADIGKVALGQQAHFTVDAYPDKKFDAKVKEIRLSPKVTQGVVTYETLLDVENPELLLKPGMTATAYIIVRHLKDVLLIPNGALRFSPPSQVAQAQRKGILGAIMPFRPPPQAPSITEAKKGGVQSLAYKVEGDKLIPIKVTLGETDGRRTQVKSGDLKPGDLVAVGIIQERDGR